MSIDISLLFTEIEKRGLTVRGFAKLLGIGEMKVYSWRAGRGKPKGEDYVKVMNWLANEKGAEAPHNDHFEIAVLIHRVAFLLAKQSGRSEAVEFEQIKKDAQLLRAMV